MAWGAHLRAIGSPVQRLAGHSRARQAIGRAPRSQVWTQPRKLWICPRCSVRLVSRNLSHSCGRFTLEGLFAEARPGVPELAVQYAGMLRSLGDVQVIPQKTRLTCVARVRFAGLYPRRTGFRANFALHRWLDSPRILGTDDHGPRWRMHYVDVRAQADLDDELRCWLQESQDVVGMQLEDGGPGGTR